eukprot:1553135-Pyramimonas_sp.AAC.1
MLRVSLQLREAAGGGGEEAATKEFAVHLAFVPDSPSRLLEELGALFTTNVLQARTFVKPMKQSPPLPTQKASIVLTLA